MKKILRTILVVILLTVAFVFYMKWFNAPLAETTSSFIFNSEIQSDNCAMISGDILDENEVISKLNKLEEHMNTLEDLIELQNTEITPNQFETDVIVEEEPTEDELFEEFKTWRANNK